MKQILDWFTFFELHYLIYLGVLAKLLRSIGESTFLIKRVTNTTPLFLPRIDSASTYRSDKNHFLRHRFRRYLIYSVVPVNAVTVRFDLQTTLCQEIVEVSD